MHNPARLPIALARDFMKDPDHPTLAELQGCYPGNLVDVRITNQSDKYLNAFQHMEFPLIQVNDLQSNLQVYVRLQNSQALSISCYSREVRNAGGLIGILSPDLFGPLRDDSFLLRLGDDFPSQFEKVFGGSDTRLHGSPITEILTIIADPSELADRDKMYHPSELVGILPIATDLYALLNSGDLFSHESFEGLDAFWDMKGKRPIDF